MESPFCVMGGIGAFLAVELAGACWKSCIHLKGWDFRLEGKPYANKIDDFNQSSRHGDDFRNLKKLVGFIEKTSGRGGIRTHGCLATSPVFKTGALNHSATLPCGLSPKGCIFIVVTVVEISKTPKTKG